MNEPSNELRGEREQMDERDQAHEGERVSVGAQTVSAALAKRRSIRAFTEQPVSLSHLRGLIEKAQRAPSGGNLQPWQAIVVTGEPWARVKFAVAERIAMGPAGREPEYAIYPENLTEPWESRRREVGEVLYDALGIAREDRSGRLRQFMSNFQGFDAPVMLFLYCSRIMGPPQWSDMGMWLQSLMLLLVEAGLASCPQECWAIYGATLHRELGLSDDHIFFTGLAIGYAEAHPINTWPVPRASLDETVDFRGFAPEA